ncbi:MAG: transcriptional regulator, family [Frondihabitans sp.]|nr:transcriptional regulator, family [Frondihabitans sp.]
MEKIQPVSISARQLKAARALCGWSRDDLAKTSGVSEITIKRIEAGPGSSPIDCRESTARKLIAALEADGVTFLPDDEPGGPGVRRRKGGRYSRA